MSVFIKTSQNLDCLADQLRLILNIPPCNRTNYIRDQKRVGSNIGGGEYYLFEVLGFQVCLIENKGEVAYDEYKEYTFYMTLLPHRQESKELEVCLLEHIAVVLREEGFAVVTAPDLV